MYNFIINLISSSTLVFSILYPKSVLNDMNNGTQVSQNYKLVPSDWHLNCESLPKDKLVYNLTAIIYYSECVYIVKFLLYFEQTQSFHLFHFNTFYHFCLETWEPRDALHFLIIVQRIYGKDSFYFIFLHDSLSNFYLPTFTVWNTKIIVSEHFPLKYSLNNIQRKTVIWFFQYLNFNILQNYFEFYSITLQVSLFLSSKMSKFTSIFIYKMLIKYFLIIKCL